MLLSAGANVNLQNNVCDIYENNFLSFCVFFFTCIMKVGFSVLYFVIFFFLSNRMEPLPSHLLPAKTTKR